MNETREGSLKRNRHDDQVDALDSSFWVHSDCLGNCEGSDVNSRQLFSITSIDPIRDAVACGDDTLVEAVVSLRSSARIEEFGEDSHEDATIFRNHVESMIKCDSPPAVEPGRWTYVVEYLARHFRLALDSNLPFNEGWKHYSSWKPYRQLIASDLAPQSVTILEYLENGRPFRGKKVDHDGCIFAWLLPQEVKELSESLSHLPESVVTDVELLYFHKALVDSLQLVASDSKTLFMSAH